MIAKAVDDNQHNWTDVLPHVMSAYRCAVHESTGYSPNYLFFGREVYTPIDLATQPTPPGFLVEDYVDEVERSIRYSHQLARECLRAQTNRRKKYYDLKVNAKSYQRNDWVWYYFPRRYTGKSPKWQRQFTGPFLVVEKLGPVNYIIQRSSKADPIIVHVDKLKSCESETPLSWLLSQHLTVPDNTYNEDVNVEATPTPTVVHNDSDDVTEVKRPKREVRQPQWMHNHTA